LPKLSPLPRPLVAAGLFWQWILRKEINRLFIMPTRESRTLPPPAVHHAESALHELIRTLGLLVRVQQTYFARFGLSGSQWNVLRCLQRSEEEGREGLRLTDLSERLLIRPPSVTGLIDRLERAGLVLREGSRTDMRAKQVALTPKGREVIEQALTAQEIHVEGGLGVLSASEANEFHCLLSGFRQHLEALLSRGEGRTGG
jgi:DNA-binding MarR family transcriptional regulator